MNDMKVIKLLTDAANLELTGPFLTFGTSGAKGYKVRDVNTRHPSSRDGSHHLLKATFSILPHESGNRRMIEDKAKAAIVAVKLMILTGWERVKTEEASVAIAGNPLHAESVNVA